MHSKNCLHWKGELALAWKVMSGVERFTWCNVTRRGQESRKWYVDLAEFGIGSADPREAERANNGSSRARVRVSFDAPNRLLFRGVTDLRLESKRKRLTSIRRAQVRLNSPILAKLSRYPEIIYLPLASSSFTGNRILIQSQVAFSVTKYLIQSKIKLVTNGEERVN